MTLRNESAVPAVPAAATYDVFVARQPIFEIDGRLAAYELLYRRSADVNDAGSESPEARTAEVLVQTFLNMGLDKVTGSARAYLNFTREMLLQRVHSLFDPRQLVIEVLETVEPDDEVMRVLEEMVRGGYALALDDFAYHPRWERILPSVTVVKIDVLDKSPQQLSEIVERLRPFGVTLLAERVETREVAATCRALGFTLFQGYYYQRPEILAQQELSAGQVTILRLMNLLRDVQATDRRLEDAFRGDLSLTIKLLRTVNTAAMGGRGIESIRHAVQLVGRAELHKWLALLLMSSVATRGGTDLEVVRAALARARFAELIGIQKGDRRASESLFMVGLFSLIEAALRLPLPEILAQIGLADEIERALTARSGPYAGALSLIEAYERGAWDVVAAEAGAVGLESLLLAEMYVGSVDWARERLGEM